MADCRHHVELCAECGGLLATRLDRLPGGPAQPVTAVYIGPVPEPCTPEVTGG